jgi:Na+/proline symporter
VIDVTTVWIMLAVIFLIFAIAIIYRKWAASIERYVVAERAQSPWINGLALFSTYLSAWAVLGGPGICYAYGIVEFATFVGWGIGVFIILWYYLPKIRDLGAKYGATGLASFMEAYFNSRHVGIVAGIVSWYALLYYLVGQIKGLGLAFSYGTGLKYEVAAIVAIAVVLVYLILSGLKAVIIVDAFCTIVMIAFFTASLYLVFALGGGNIFNTIEKISSYDPRLLYPTGAPYTSDPISLWVFSVLVYAMWQFTPYAWQNYLALRSSKKKDLAIFVSLATVSGGLITWVLILGPVGRVFLPYKVSPDTVVLEVGKYFLPSLYPLFLVGIFLTILATVDSTLLAGSADLYVALR